MLTFLSIQNFTLIENLEIEFSEGMNVITGETGAGKSILLGALSLITGQRADTSSILNKEKKCVIEGHFNVEKHDLKSFFSLNELDYEPTTIVRREILPNSRTRAFINDTPVNINLLKEFSEKLIDIHSQHNFSFLMNHNYQMEVLDDFSNNTPLLNDYKKLYKSYITDLRTLDKLIIEDKQAKNDIDYLTFLLNELEEASLIEDEQEVIEKELHLLNNTEELKRKLNEVLGLFNNEPHNVIIALKDSISKIRDIAGFIPDYAQLLERLESAFLELKDLAGDFEMTEDRIVFSQEKIDELNERLSLIFGLQKKHRANSISELLALKKTYEEQLKNIHDAESIISELKEKIETDEKQLKKWAENLSSKRLEYKPKLEHKITDVLKELSMPNASFLIELETSEMMKNNGVNKILFKFSANKGIVPEDISKVASGGELSRVMLAIKSVVSQKKLLPGLIFDEIDTGISGEAAVKTSTMLNEMSKSMQIIAITHLPQIARLGSTHFYVYKDNSDIATKTLIKKISNTERVHTIASMISGNKITEASILTAKELLSDG